MLKKYKAMLTALVLLMSCVTYGQVRDSIPADTNKHLNEVTVRAYLSDRVLINIPASVTVLSAQQLSLQPANSLVTAMNTIPGVRMEERSPGSYRLAIRGSLLRSPFGIRDVKIYFDEIPLTDAGGNTYLNNIDVTTIQGIEVLKGPDGSIFGANSGGVVLINPVNKLVNHNFVNLGISGGSFGLLHQNAWVQNKQANNQLNINEAYQTYNGYRQNSSMRRTYLQLVDKLSYAKQNSVKLLGFYSDMNYQTPGGLTLSQFEADPTAARQATKASLSAIDLKAAIYSKMLFGGVVTDTRVTDKLHNVFTVFGTHVDFTNPSFTTYEQRKENTAGLRTYFEWQGPAQSNFTWKVNLGGEWQQTNTNVANYDNSYGNKGNAQTQDYIHTRQSFVFTRFEAQIFKKLLVEAALSFNNYQYQFKNLYPLAQTEFVKRPFHAELMPRLALSYQVNTNIIWRASVSRGYSTPTTGEVRPTDHIINPTLQAQDGYNYETGFRIHDKNDRFLLDASVFYYRLNNAIVQLTHADGTTYYTNTGGTNQPGAELYFTGWLLEQKKNGFIRGLQFNQSCTYSRFTFRDYANNTGNNLTGVPKNAFISSIQTILPQELYAFIQYSFTDKLPLNDANTIYAAAYHILQAKIGWKHLYRKNQFELFAGADNLLNQVYSLGDDLNAAANRYYNPAPARNYFAGINVML